MRTTVVKISSFFMLLNKNEMGVSDIFLYHGVYLSRDYIVLLCAYDLSYIDVVLCPSSTPLLAGCARSRPWVHFV